MNRLDNNSRTMTRRNGVGVKVILTVAAGLFVVYCLYSYHEIHTRLKKSDEKGERLRQQHDSLSAQLQVVYEHKSRLEKTLQQEKADHRKSKNDLMSQKSELETRFYNEKQELLNRISSINQEHKMLQSQHEDLQMELSKLHESHNKLQEDNEVIQSQHNAEYQQLKQEKENELASLKDEVANLQRTNLELQKKLDLLMQSNQYNMKQQQQFVQQQQKQPIYDANQQQNQNIQQAAAQQPVQQQQQFGVHDQAGFQQGGFNQQHDQVQVQQQQQFQQQADVQQGGFGQQNQFNQPHDTLQQHQQQPAAQQQFNQFNNQVPIVQQKQPGDNVNFQPKFDDKLSDQHGVNDQQQEQQHPQQQEQQQLPQQHQEQGGFHVEQNQQQQEEHNNQINQMQVNPPDLNKENHDDFVRGRKFPDNRDPDEEVQPGRLRRDFPDDQEQKKDDGANMQIGKPRFADGGLGQPNMQGKDHIQAPDGGNFNQIQMPKVDQNVVGNDAKEVNNEEDEDRDENEPRNRQQQQQQMQQPDLAQNQPRQQFENQAEEYDGEEMNRDNQVVAPAQRDPGQDSFNQIKQPRPDGDVYHHKEEDENDYGEDGGEDHAAAARDF